MPPTPQWTNIILYHRRYKYQINLNAVTGKSFHNYLIRISTEVSDVCLNPF